MSKWPIATAFIAARAGLRLARPDGSPAGSPHPVWLHICIGGGFNILCNAKHFKTPRDTDNGLYQCLIVSGSRQVFGELPVHFDYVEIKITQLHQ